MFIVLEAHLRKGRGGVGQAVHLAAAEVSSGLSNGGKRAVHIAGVKRHTGRTAVTCVLPRRST